ncbi:MAG: carbohydrate-binding domain-containing protein, partial [Planctomycetales bacterium]|nr:carbohydrate-binding domain-containing protein [Planctomycetales bacterium]
CSIRAAVDEAAAATTPVVVHLGAGETHTLSLAGADDTNAGGDLDVRAAGGTVTLVAEAPGAAVVAPGSDGVIDVHEGTVRLVGVGASGATGDGWRVRSGAVLLAEGATSHSNGGAGLAVDTGAVAVTTNVTLAGNGATYTNSTGVIDSYSAAAIKADSAINITGGVVTTTSSGTGGKGLKSDGTITIGSITGGPTLNITTTGARFQQSGSDYNHPKTIVADGAISIVNGTTTLNSTDDGVHSKTSITISGGTHVIDAISPTQGVGEGVEAPIINFTGGTTSIVASNDGINSTYGTVPGGAEGNDGSQLNISGGIIVAYGVDAIDANGDITITGGVTILDGRTNGPEEAIDYNGTFLMNGGTLIAAGSNSNMTKAAGSASTQVNFFLKSSAALASTSLLHIQDSSGSEVLTYKPRNNVYYFHVSTPALAKNAQYQVYYGGTYTGGSYVGGLSNNNTWGLLTGGTWSSTGATLKKTFTTSSTATVNTQSF